MEWRSNRWRRCSNTLLIVFIKVLFFSQSNVFGAEPSFDQHRLFGFASNSTYSVVAGDMDGDGDLDIITGDLGKQNFVYLNDGTGNYNISRPFGTGIDETLAVAVGDMDMDNDLDIITGNRTGQNFVYLNDGGGNFDEARSFGTAMNITGFILGVAVGDMDKDGDLDIITGNPYKQNFVYINDGTGNFNTTRSFGTGANNINSIAVGDVDRDNDLDIITGNPGEQSLIYFNDGSSNFNSTRPFGASFDNILGVVMGDMDGDDDLDIVTANYARQKFVYLNDGTGNFGITRPFGTQTDLSRSVTVGDLDGDGDLDIITGTWIGNNLTEQNTVYLNDGASNFSTARPFEIGRNYTTSVTAADTNGDGNLDIIAGYTGQPNAIHINNGVSNFSMTRLFGTGRDNTASVAVGDMDGDGDLDIVVGNPNEQNLVYLNDGASNFTVTRPFGNRLDYVLDIALGDIDSDRDLDIITANYLRQSYVYLNDGNGNFGTIRPFGGRTDPTNSVAVGDMDGDGSLDIITGNTGGQNMVHLNGKSHLFGTGTDKTNCVAVGDMDGDGDLDIVVGNQREQSMVYLNDGGGSFGKTRPFGTEYSYIAEVAIGDVNGDGNLDIVTANPNEQNLIFLNDGAGNFGKTLLFGTGTDFSRGGVLGDMDGDGDLDIVVGNHIEQNFVYLNDGTGNFDEAFPFGTGVDKTNSLAVGDMNKDGSLDIIIGNTGEQNLVYLNGFRPSTVTTKRPGITADANFFSTSEQFVDKLINIPYMLANAQEKLVGKVRTCYSLNGGGHWQLAVKEGRSAPATQSVVQPPQGCPYVPAWEKEQQPPQITSIAGVPYTFTWDTFASGFFGQSDNVVFRIEAYPDLRPQKNSAPVPYQYPFVSSMTFPFRVRGTQVQVIDEGNRPLSNASVYRIQAGQEMGGVFIGNGNVPFRTNPQGYLAGRGELNLGDRLLALAPVPWTPTTTMTWAVGLTNTIHLYYTNGTPTELGLETHISNTNSPTVMQPGVQQLRVSAAHPLILFDLRLALEWDASTDPNQRYLNQLRADLKQASAFLYDFTNGQAALGHITVTQNAEDWGYADVVVQATNRLRPLAVQGGVVTTGTVDLDHPDIIYETGQVRMGATWNRYGEPGQNLGQDWPLALAHELSHYFFFLDDTYLGQNQDDLLIPVDSCVGSVMGDMYDPSGINTEFLSNPEWSTRCTNTLAQRTLGRSEWETIRQRYPWLHDAPNTGPARMPFDFTTITILDPLTPTTTLPDPIFYLDYSDNSVSSASGRAFLLRADKYIFDLGSPVGGQNRLLVRGARPGDRLCAFDGQRFAYGCEIVESADERLTMKQDTAWAPQIQISPITSTTVSVSVRLDADLGGTLYARLYPEYGEAGPAVLLVRDGILYQGLLQLSQPLLNGHLQLWVEGTEAPNETNPRREAIVAFALGGNLGKGPAIRAGGPAIRAGGPAIRAGGPAIRAGGPLTRSGHAPLVSPDGQMIFFTTDPNSFHEGELYTIQSTAALPPLPPGKLLIGLGYSVIASPNVTQMPNGSVSFQYLGSDALVQGITEAQEQKLTIHAWRAGSGWQALPTLTSAKYNLASAQGVGAGIYALLWGVTQPAITTMTPTVVTNQATSTLSLHGQGFLAPVTLLLTGSNALTIPLAAQIVDSTTLTVVLPPTLPTQAYQVTVINGDGGFVQAPGVLSVMAPQAACFYDRFESGANQWQMSGAWGIVTLGDSSEHAISDSPEGNYNNADLTTMAATAITSQRFNLSLCPQPQLTFRHAYVIAQGQGHQDRAWVEISTDNGASWNALASYSGGGIYPRAFAAIVDQEWRGVPLEPVLLDLGGYQGEVRLRFRLEVDQQVADKGWVIDDIFVQSRMDGTANNKVFLPVIQR